MTPNPSEYENRLNYLHESLVEKLSENQQENFSLNRIEESVSRVMLEFKNRLKLSEKAKEDFISTSLNRWDARVFDPIAKVTEILCIKILIEKQKQKENEEKRVKHLEELKKEKDSLRKYLQALSIDQDEDSDDESLHLEESKPSK